METKQSFIKNDSELSYRELDELILDQLKKHPTLSGRDLQIILKQNKQRIYDRLKKLEGHRFIKKHAEHKVTFYKRCEK